MVLEGIVADVLVRVLGSYVDGLNKESIRVAVWRGDLELKSLRLRPDALAVLFEGLGLDLPVTVTAGYIGLLRLEVPWKSLRSAPVRIFMHDVTVVASPVSDGDQSALELREKRLKAARLATDEAVRDAKFSVRSSEEHKRMSSSTATKSSNANAASAEKPTPAVEGQSSGYGVARWGWRFTSRVVTKIVDNIQIEVENVIVQYEDASSVRDRPYTATLALDSLRACSTNFKWVPVFIENPLSPVVHKVLYLQGLVLNWEPGNANNELKSWILDTNAERSAAQWAGFVRKCSRHAIKPMDGELRIALTKSSALAAALAGKNEFRGLRAVPRVQMDLHFPDVKIIMDDFQYHTLLSTIMYLSDIDRKVRPTTARGRWFWALDRLLPRFKERREAALRFNAEGLRKRREKREAYCKARNAVVNARRKGASEPKMEARIVEELETEFSYDDIVRFRDLADRELIEAAKSGIPDVASTSRFWSLFSRGNWEPPGTSSRESSGRSTPKRSRSRDSITDSQVTEEKRTFEQMQIAEASKTRSMLAESVHDEDGLAESQISENDNKASKDPLFEPTERKEGIITPNFRMGFLLGRGTIVLKEGGFPDVPTSVSSLEFGELKIGIETRPGAGLLLEALLGTFQVIDLRKSIKVMYPRVPWSGEESEREFPSDSNESVGVTSNSSHLIADLAGDWERSKSSPSETITSYAGKSTDIELEEACLHSYPHEISNALCEIRGEYGMESGPLPVVSPIFPRVNPHASAFDNDSSSSSLSTLSDSRTSSTSTQNIEDLSVVRQTPLRYIAALRLNQEEATDGEWASGATRMAMDLAIGGMEVLVDGPKGAFISSVTFWHPREKMPSIMHFLMRAAAPRLASLRMDIQKALLERSVPMRVDMLIRGPRFVVPGTAGRDISLVLDFGTFAMETSTGPPQVVRPEACHSLQEANISMETDSLSIRYTDYKMACSDLGLFVVPEAGKHAAERIIKPFSVHLLLQVLHNSSFVEAITLVYGKVAVPKVKLQAQLPSLNTSVSHDAFWHILDVAKGWGDRSREPLRKSGIEPNPVFHSVSLSADLEKVRMAHDRTLSQGTRSDAKPSSPLVAFEMRLEFEDLQLELRDSACKRIVTLSSTGTVVKLKRRVGLLDFDFRVRTFVITDGSRGATAPFRRLAYAGTEKHGDGSHQCQVSAEDPFSSNDSRAFISLSYRGDITNQEQSLRVKILSLHLVCVRETYFALADFFYLKEKHGHAAKSSWMVSEQEIDSDWADFNAVVGSGPSAEPPANSSDGEGEYSDPFAALGTTTSAAARALREQAGRGMEFSKQALANRGRLSVTADLDGINLTLVTADGAIGSFDITNCKVCLTQSSSGAIDASGELGGFCIRDLTAAYDVYSETIRYSREQTCSLSPEGGEVDGWSLHLPDANGGDIWLEARLRNMRIVYLQRFIIILKKYFDALRDSLKPVLDLKGGIGEVFEGAERNEFSALKPANGRIRVNVMTESIDIVMPRHSQSPYEALRFYVPRSSITNEGLPAPGYRVGFQVQAEDVNAYVLYELPAEGEGRALTEGGKDPVLRQISPNSPVSGLVPFSENISIFAKIDAWREHRVPEVVMNADGIPVLKDGEEEREYDPAKWIPALRVRICAPFGISTRLCEAEYSILYFVFTENVIERPDIEFTDIVRGLKTPVLPSRKPVQPIMFSSNRMPPNYQILFEVPRVDSVIMSGADQTDHTTKLIKSELRDIVGSFDYGVDFRMTIEVSGNLTSLEDVRLFVPTHGKRLVMPTRNIPQHLSPHDGNSASDNDGPMSSDNMSRAITFTWDRPFGFRANVMVVMSDLRIIVEPELFRDLGKLTVPGFPFLKSSAPAPFVRFNGRLLIATISKPEIWLMANQYPGDDRSLVIRGDIIAKVQWAALTGRKMVEIAANGIHMNLSSVGPFRTNCADLSTSFQFKHPTSPRSSTETPMLYPCDVSMKLDGSGYDPPKDPDSEPIKVACSSLSVNAESFLFRIDVNDAPLILAVGSRLVRSRPSALSSRPPQPGRFDEWIDKGDDGDSKLVVHFALPHSRLMFTDESAGRYIPILEARMKNLVVRSNFPWLSNLAFEFALDLFNEEKGWWEPGMEIFPIEIAASKGRSGSQAIHIRADKNIYLNVTPNTVYGAARVSSALKAAVEDLAYRLRLESMAESSDTTHFLSSARLLTENIANTGSRRPSVAAFCVRNETGRTMTMWLPYDTKRRTLRGNGGEVEVDLPTDEMSWLAVGVRSGDQGNSRGDGHLAVNTRMLADPNNSRQLAMRCVISLNGYEPLTLSAAETSSRLITFMPDNLELSTVPESRGEAPFLTLVWSVTMRDGVPCGCLRSVFRLLNKTRDNLEVNIGGLAKSPMFGDNAGLPQKETLTDADRNVHTLLRPGDTWSVPEHSVYRSVRLRPTIFSASDDDTECQNGAPDLREKERIFYRYKWSDPLSNITALQNMGERLGRKEREDSGGVRWTNSCAPITPIVTCRAIEKEESFCLSILPRVLRNSEGEPQLQGDTPAWIDVYICPPLVLENLLPRPIYFKLATTTVVGGARRDPVVGQGSIQPLREAHVHTAGTDLSTVSIALALDNNPCDPSSSGHKHSFTSRRVGNFHDNIANLKTIPMGTGRYVPLRLNIDQEQSLTTKFLRVYCNFWIRNRSDSDLFFKDSMNSRDSRTISSPKMFLRGCPPGTVAEKFTCFSGAWISFQRADATEDLWVDVGTEVSEIDKPISLRFERLSLLLEARPGKGKFQKSLVVTILNAAWLENRTGAPLQWCQPAALNPRGIALSTKVHTLAPGKRTALHWDFGNKKKAICLRRANETGSSDWIWSRPVLVEGIEGEFAAKMYRPKRHEQYIARVVISKPVSGVASVVVHKEDRSTPPYKIMNHCRTRSIAFRQSGVNESHPWLVRPGKSSRYSWDDPQTPVKRRSLVIEVIEDSSTIEAQTTQNSSIPPDGSLSDSVASELTEVVQESAVGSEKKGKATKTTKFDLNIDMVQRNVPFTHSKRIYPPLAVSVHVDGPTKVVTFDDVSRNNAGVTLGEASKEKSELVQKSEPPEQERDGLKNLDVELFVKGLGISFVESRPVELAYLSVSGVHWRLDRFDGQQLIICEVQDLQLDNQLVHCSWPVVLWSPPPADYGKDTKKISPSEGSCRSYRKPFFQFTIDGPYPSIKQGIGTFRGVFMALQQLQLAADEDFVLRVWLFVVSLIDAAGGTSGEKEEALTGRDGLESGLWTGTSRKGKNNEFGEGMQEATSTVFMTRLYVEHLELCPMKLTVSFTSSRTSTAAEQIEGFRSLMRTLVAVLGNVENAEFRFNALELRHMFDTTSHFRSLITEFYVSQGSNQKMTLLTSNSLIGNPSALFDSIAIGTRDFFVEPASAKGSADFIASIGRGSSSLLTNTVGGIVGSLGGIPRAVAQGLETAMGDRDYLAERDSIRGGRARVVSSPAQGLFTGALSFGHGIASGAAGLIRDPIQGAAEAGPSGFIRGLGKGFIGGVLKPITGALDLLAEPAAGFRSMMVSDRSLGSAEPIRPPRAFWGGNADRMMPYDVRASLGQAILEAVNRTESSHSDERLLSWTHLVVVHSRDTNAAQPNVQEEDVIMFLWALLRRSTRSSHVQTKYLLDADGNPQRAEKMRAGLITNKRLIITSLDGHVIWEYPLVDIADTQVSVGAKDYLMVGMRPIGHKSQSIAPTGWQKIHCGSIESRDSLNMALQKALQELRAASNGIALYQNRNGTSGRVSGHAKDMRSEHHRERSLELADMSENLDVEPEGGQMYEMKIIHQDASSVDGRRGVFTNVILPGRRGRGSEAITEMKDDSIFERLETVIRQPLRHQLGAVRSVRICLVNLTEKKLVLLTATLDSGQWAHEPAQVVQARTVSAFEADGTKDRVADIAGYMTMCIENSDSSESEVVAISFLNPLLAPNAFAVQAPSGYTINYKGGEKGDHVTTVVTLKRAPRPEDAFEDNISMMTTKKTSAEPLLFGRSKISPQMQPEPSKPPIAKKTEYMGFNDPELIPKLSSLGFSREEATEALQRFQGDLSNAYASLIDQKEKS